MDGIMNLDYKNMTLNQCIASMPQDIQRHFIMPMAQKKNIEIMREIAYVMHQYKEHRRFELLINCKEKTNLPSYIKNHYIEKWTDLNEEDREAELSYVDWCISNKEWSLLGE